MPGPAGYHIRVRRSGFLTLALLSLIASEAFSEGPDRAHFWKTKRPVPIAIRDGKAKFSFIPPTPESRMLVIVSSLARKAEAFPIEMVVKSIDSSLVERPAIETDRPVRVARSHLTSLQAVGAPSVSTPPSERIFHLMVREGDTHSPSNYLALRGQLALVGERVQIYVDEATPRPLVAGLLNDVISTFDNNVFPVAASTLGKAHDVDGDGRFTILISPWLSRLGGGRHAVDGFVRSADFIPGLGSPFSNQCDMMYLSSDLAPGPHLRTILAHEYTHAISFSTKSTSPPKGPCIPEEEGWLDEGVAHLVEDLHGFSRSNLDYRVSAFLSDPARYRLVVEDYYTANLFRSHGNRGSAYLFLRWCADQYGPKFLPTLIRSQRVGLENLEGATGCSFPALFRAWSVAVFMSGLERDGSDPRGYRTLDLRRPLAGWELGGPRSSEVRAGEPQSFQLMGTACQFMVVEPSKTGGTEIAISAPSRAELQVTAVPLPDDLGLISVEAHFDQDEEGTALSVALEARSGEKIELTGIAWEPLVPGPDPHAPTFRRACLDRTGLVAAFGTTKLATSERLTSKPLYATDAIALGVPLVVKAVGTDARGRRVAGWGVISPRR